MRRIPVEIVAQDESRFCHESCPFFCKGGGCEFDVLNGTVAHCRLFCQKPPEMLS